MKISILALYLVAAAFVLNWGACLDNGLGKTPPMGWNSWNHFGCNISEALIREVAGLMVSTGLAAKGYKYLNLDDCWQVKNAQLQISRSSTTKEIQEDRGKFPSGMPQLIEFVHEKGLLFGLYSDAGTQTCQGRPGSYNYQRYDANTYAKWGVDYLKYDNCHNQMIPAKFRYPIMRDALNQSGRHIYFSMCDWGFEKPHTWAQSVANSWRTTPDIKDSWLSFLAILKVQENLAPFSGPGAWNDPDMLEVGNGGMTTNQYQSHFALWAVLKAPLLIGCDLKTMSSDTLRILLNQELIDINQDPLGKQASLLSQNVSLTHILQVWGGQISGNRYVYVFFNLEGPSGVTFKYNLNSHNPTPVLEIRELVSHQNVKVPQDPQSFETKQIQKHSVAVYLVKFSQSCTQSSTDGTAEQ